LSTEPLPNRDDAHLAQQIAGGDRQAAALLIGRYQASVRQFLKKITGDGHLAEDLAQDTFVRMLKYADRYNPKWPMRTWLLTIARRLAINSHRKLGRMKPTADMASSVSPHAGPDAAAAEGDERRAMRQQLDRALEQLTEPQRQAIVLFYQQELSIEAVAAVMEVPEGTVKSHLHRGRAALRNIMTDNPRGAS